MAKPRGDLQLAIGYWIVSHKDQLRTWWAVSLLAVIGGSLLWAIAFFSVFFIQQASLEKNIAASGAKLSAYQQSAALAPTDIEVSAVTVLRRDATHVDVVVMASNPNTTWGLKSAEVEWRVGRLTLPIQTVFLNPSSTRPIMALNVEVDDASTVQATAEMRSEIWARASAAPLPDPQFTTSGLALSPRTVQGPDGNSFSTVNVRGDVVNQSVYNFFRVLVPLVVKSGEAIVAVDQVTQTNWPTLSAKSFNTTWAYPVSGATSVEAWPQVSRFEAANLYR